jgi:hypothetical protein
MIEGVYKFNAVSPKLALNRQSGSDTIILGILGNLGILGIFPVYPG